MVFAFYFQVPTCLLLSMGAQTLWFATPQPIRVYPRQAYVPPGDGLWCLPGVHWVAALHAVSSRESLLLCIQLSPSHSINMVGYAALGVQQSPNSCIFLTRGEGSSFLASAPSDDLVNSESVMGVKASDSGVVIGYQVDEYTHSCSADHLIAMSDLHG